MFAKFECYACHEVKGETFQAPKDRKNVGPELSAMGPLHEAAYFAESIISPSAVIEKGKGYEGPDGSSKMPSFNDSMTVQEAINLVLNQSRERRRAIVATEAWSIGAGRRPAHRCSQAPAVRGHPHMRGIVVLILLLGVVLGSCAVSDGHLLDTKPVPDPCDIQPVSIKAGAQHEPSLERAVLAVTPRLPDTTVVWHCGPPPDTRPTVVAVNSPSLSPHGPLAPPRG